MLQQKGPCRRCMTANPRLVACSCVVQGCYLCLPDYFHDLGGFLRSWVDDGFMSSLFHSRSCLFISGIAIQFLRYLSKAIAGLWCHLQALPNGTQGACHPDVCSDMPTASVGVPSLVVCPGEHIGAHSTPLQQCCSCVARYVVLSFVDDLGQKACTRSLECLALEKCGGKPSYSEPRGLCE